MLQIAFVLHASEFSGLARVDINSLSEQSLLEMVFHGASVASRLRNKDLEFIDIQEWEGITFTGDTGSVEALSVLQSYNAVDQPLYIGGTVYLEYLPSKVKRLSIVDFKLEGTLDTSGLPRDLERICVGFNCLSGTFHIPGLPRRMKSIGIYSNSFSGSLDVLQLPDSITVFDSSENSFSSSVDLRYLPSSLQRMSLAGNNFSQDVLFLGELPDSLFVLNLENLRIGNVCDLAGNSINDGRLRMGMKKRTAFHVHLNP